MEKATFAGGCFWCMVTPFEEQPGIHGIISGYAGGHVENPTYEQVKTGETGHVEVVEITFDPDVFPYERLLELYWPQIDPTDDGGQFQDRGHSIVRRSSCIMNVNVSLLNSPNRNLPPADDSINPLLRKFGMRLYSIRLKTIIRITTRKTRNIIRKTVRYPDGTNL